MTEGNTNRPADPPEFEENIRELSPEVQLAVFSKLIGPLDRPNQVMVVAVMFAEEGVNIWRVIRENRERAEDILDVELPHDPTDRMVERFDEYAARLGADS